MQRSEEIRRGGIYLGHLEWAAWAFLNERRVKVCLGREIMDMYEWVVDYLGYAFMDPPKQEAHIACVKIDGLSGQWLPVNRHGESSNHFVLAKRRRLAPLEGLPEPLWSPPGGSAKEEARKAGLMLMDTVAQGDCAPDCMAYFMCLPREKRSWLAIRTALADFLQFHAKNPLWQEIATLCGEAEPGHVPAGLPPGGLGPGSSSACGKAAELAKPPLGSSGASICIGEAPGDADSPRDIVRRSSSPSPELHDELRDESRICAALGNIVPVAPDAAPEEARLVPLEDCHPVKAISGQTRFVDWIRDLSLEDLDNISRCYDSYKDAEMKMLRSQGVIKTPLEFRPQKHFVATRRVTRLATGSKFEQWCATDAGKASKAKLRDFLMQTFTEYRTFAPKHKRKWVADCVRDWKGHVAENVGLGACLPRGRRPCTAAGRRPEHLLMRARGLQGRPFKAPEVRDMLWQWFVDIRASVAGIITPKMIMFKAKELCERVLQQQRKTGCYSALPQIGRKWLLGWKRDRGVVLRKPNARYKCSRQVMRARLRVMWLNLIKIRRLAVRMLGKDLADQLYGIDEKPLHFNESGSKALATLEIAGAKSVALKQNHAATRQRVSLMTSVTSNPLVAGGPGNMPLELLSRAKSNWATKALRKPPGISISFQWADKGSYRNEHILTYLDRWLAPWTEARAGAQDWRILMLDVAKSHIGDEVVAKAHQHGYVTLYHYGCTTGVAQVNDTHLHADFSRMYMNLECMAFAEQQIHDSSDISRNLQAVVDDACAAWALCDHRRGVSGHFSNGLSNALDGSEDWRISHTAKTFWDDLDMPSARAAAVQAVDALVDAGKITSFAEWATLVEHPGDPGVRGHEGDGTEFEGDLEPGEEPWVTEAEEQQIREDELACLEAEVHRRAPLEEQEIIPLRAGLASAARLAQMKEARGNMLNCEVPGAVGILDQHIRQVTRGLHAGGKPEAQQQQYTIRSYMDKVQAELHALRDRKRAACRRKRRVAKRKRISRKLARHEQARKAALRKELKRQVDALPVRFDIAELEQRGAAGENKRLACLERLKLLSPALAPLHEAYWPLVKRYWCTATNYRVAHGMMEGIPVGGNFLRQVEDTIQRLGTHYKAPGPAPKRARPSGKQVVAEDPLAFQQLFEKMLDAYSKRKAKGGHFVEL